MLKPPAFVEAGKAILVMSVAKLDSLHYMQFLPRQERMSPKYVAFCLQEPRIAECLDCGLSSQCCLPFLFVVCRVTKLLLTCH